MTDVVCQINISSRTIENTYTSKYVAYEKNRQFKGLNTMLNRCLNGTANMAYGFLWVYQSILDKTTINNFIKLKVPNLLVDTHPHLIKEWNINNTRDINLITYGSGDKVLWDCLVGKNHPSYLMPVATRAGQNTQCGCPECYKEKSQVYDQKEKKEHIKNHITNTDNIDTGDAAEFYIENLLENTGLYHEVIKIGQTGDITDVIVILKSGVQKSIQVKTLTKRKNGNYSYDLKVNKNYPGKLLIVAVDHERTRFSTFLHDRIGNRQITLSYKSGKTIYEDIIYRDEKNFLDKVINLIPSSLDFVETNTSGEKILERASLRRLELWCIKYGFSFRRNNTDKNSIDCYINNIPIQCKYSSVNCTECYTYRISVHKGCGVFEGKSCFMPYSINDPFEFIVVELGGLRDSEEKGHIYESQFCFIPKATLIERKILQNLPDVEGQCSINICPPDYPKYHWSKEFWENHPFKSKKPTLKLLFK
jgi:hypothetical protein